MSPWGYRAGDLAGQVHGRPLVPGLPGRLGGAQAGIVGQPVIGVGGLQGGELRLPLRASRCDARQRPRWYRARAGRSPSPAAWQTCAASANSGSARDRVRCFHTDWAW